MRPPLPYYGSKVTLAPKIADMLPEHEHYVEPFAGSLAVLLAKEPSRYETANDLDGDIVTFWRMLRDRPDDLIRVCALTPHARAEHAVSREPAADELEQARRVWVRLTQGRSAAPRSPGWRRTVAPPKLRTGGGPVSSYPRYLDGYLDRLAAAAERLKRVSIECRPALEMIDQFGAHEGVLLYIDPPYLASTRTSVGKYRFEMAREADHVELVESLRRCRAAVVLSGYNSPLYAGLYDGWHSVQMSTRANGGSARTEVLWSNRPLLAETTYEPIDQHLGGVDVDEVAAALGEFAAVDDHGPPVGAVRNAGNSVTPVADIHVINPA